ncbi:hypothetical protein BDV96DRAFT_569350 [Lophiotrema nucula]|uniref:Integral membrane protein n=1 Tax=Lophiotrema nucula TaxID=690887 RepID=A0A6A5ZGA9_9PLEO|nr:hypothetical protein BDV96DRAFT_569350 [Lophiotrema nucula]
MANRNNQTRAEPSRYSTTTTTTTTQGPRITTTSYTTGSPHTTVTTSGPQNQTIVHPTVTTATRHELPLHRTQTSSSSTQTERQPSVRIRRQRAENSTQTETTDSQPASTPSNRRRSSSEPQRPRLVPPTDDELEIRRQVTTTATPLQTLHEEGPRSQAPQFLSVPAAHPPQRLRRPGLGRQSSGISIRSRIRDVQEYDPDLVDMLDVIDPEVGALTTLNNIQNSLFIPNLGSFYRRQPTYDLSHSSPDTPYEEKIDIQHGAQVDAEKEANEEGRDTERPTDLSRQATSQSIASVLTGISEGHNYAVLPHGASLPGWTDEEKAALNDHVRHLLHSRRAKFKRRMKGFWRYISKPVGFLVFLYAFLLTFWGAAWVLFLIGWISVQGRQHYFIEICDQILTALFCVVGIGFAPWRAVDTYHMIYVAKYAHKTWRLRKEQGLPPLKDRNELPARPLAHAWETGDEVEKQSDDFVLSPSEQSKLEHHQAKLSKSHTFYKPHETTTHQAFSVRLLITIVVLLDCHSLFQMALGGTTWGIYYKHRPKALTAVILSCSISCNISAGMVISVGDRRSRKKLIVEQMFRQGLTEEALEKLRKERGLKAKGVSGKPKEETVRDV